MTGIEKVAEQIGVGTDILSVRLERVLNEQGAAWAASGKNEDDSKTMALRVAARQIVSERAKIARSGCTSYEGMLVKVPPYKDWGRNSYQSMKKTLSSLDEEGRESLVSQGSVVIFEDNHDGTYTRYFNPSLLAKQAFEVGSETDEVSEQPNRIFELDENTSFYVVWDKANPTFPSGDSNFKYGAPRPLQELDRQCLFLGREAGTTGDLDIFTVRLSGEIAKNQYEAFRPGTIAVKPGRNNNLYSKAGVTDFQPDDSLASIFSGPPLAIGDEGPEGIIPSVVTEFLHGLHSLPDYYQTHREDSDWWGQWVGFIGEVIHIDPREKGGYTLSVGDLDITSTAPSIDIVVPAGVSLDFAVGSQIVVVGAPWQTKEGDTRFSNYGWWVLDAISPVASANNSDEGWDE